MTVKTMFKSAIHPPMAKEVPGARNVRIEEIHFLAPPPPLWARHYIRILHAVCSRGCSMGTKGIHGPIDLNVYSIRKGHIRCLCGAALSMTQELPNG